MSEGRTIPEVTRRSLLAGLMMALLAASVGVAWWLAASRRFDPQAAREVLGSIRKRGLPALWGDQLAANWYIRYRADGKPVGWHVAKRLRLQGGGYAGTRIEQTGDLFSIQTWALDDAARTGNYESRRWRWRTLSLPGRTVRMPVPSDTTEIGFGNGRLDVIQAVGNRAIKASAPLPDDYIPNGLTDLAMYETAAQGRKTIFPILTDGQAIANGQVNFRTLRATPEGGRVVRRNLDDAEEEVMIFEETGRPLKISYPQSGGRLEASSAEAVGKIFPDARRYQQRETTAPATQPDSPSGESQPQSRPDTAPDANGADANNPDANGPDGL
jgi:hypothetical protein